MKKNIYVCGTYFHLFITFIKVLKSNDENSIVILSTIDEYEKVIKKLKKSSLFKNVYFYDERKISKLFNEQNIETKKFRKNEMINLFNENSNIRFNDYTDIYVYNDWTTIGAYLMDSKIKYHLIEDGIDGFYYLKGNLKHRVTFLNPNFKYRVKRIIKKILNIGYDFFGQSKYVIDIEVNDKSKIFIKNNNVIEVKKEDLYNSLTKEEKLKIYELFMSGEVKIDIKENNVLLLTQPLYIDKMVDFEEDQVEIYSDMINKYIKEYKVYIKPHPRDVMDYKKINKNVVIIDKNMPIEVLKFNSNIKFDKAVTIVSSSIKSLDFVDEKIEYGFEYLDKYKRSK